MISYVTDPKIEEFILSKVTPGELGRRTAREYARDLERFGKFLEGAERGPYPSLLTAGRNDIDRFLHVVREDNLVSSTRRKLAPIRGFFQFLQRRGYRSDNPAEDVQLPMAPRRSGELLVLSRTEIERLLDAPRGKNSERDRAIFGFYYSGPKRHELPKVRLSDFDLEKQQIRIGRRIVPLSKQVADARSYASVRPKSRSNALFLTGYGTPLSMRQSWAILKRYVKKINLPDNTSVEALRSSYAVHALEDGAYVGDVQVALGTTSMNNMQDYIRLAHVARQIPRVDGEVLTSVAPFARFSECARDIRQLVIDAILRYGTDDTAVPSEVSNSVAIYVKRIAENWPSMAAQRAFSALKRHVNESRIEGYREILKSDLPALESVALEMLNASQQKKEEVGFIGLLHPRVIRASFRHFEDGDYREAVLNAMLALTEVIRDKSGLDGDGINLVSRVFKPEAPVLRFSSPDTISGRDDNEGFHKILLGAFQGVRNPKSHSMISDLTQQSAAQYLVFISLLLRRVDESQRHT